MPARRLDDQLAELRLFDVVGQDSADEALFIRHIALADLQSGEVMLGSEIPVIHMGPPLGRTARGMTLHAIGSASLTTDELEQIRVYIDELLLELAAEKVRRFRQYVIHPHFCERSEEIPCRRYSCSGFVIESYRSAGIDLIVRDNHLLPNVDLQTLERAYPDQVARLRDATVRTHLGLIGEGPWPIILAGYVMNSLDRSSDKIRNTPYRPVDGDAYFPNAVVPNG